MSSQDGLRLWTDLICRYGFCFVDGCPVDPGATEDLLKRIAYIRHTHYGGFYDFTSDLALKDTAYTNLALDVHTDTTYFSDPAGLQMFHLLSHTGGQGGYTLLVDGFEAARRLMAEDFDSFSVLKRLHIPWHASGNEGLSIQSAADNTPVIDVKRMISNDEEENDWVLHKIRWNNSDRASLHSSRHYSSWYNAARKWRRILESPDLEYRVQLQPGKPLSMFSVSHVLW